MPAKSKLTKENIEEMEARFRNGATNLEAIAGLMSEETYYKHLRENPEFAGRMDAAREHITEIARGVVAKRIQRGDTQLATWWLERRKSDLFGNKSKVENSGEQKIIVETRRHVSTDEPDPTSV